MLVLNLVSPNLHHYVTYFIILVIYTFRNLVRYKGNPVHVTFKSAVYTNDVNYRM